jgi:hypothetical protein
LQVLLDDDELREIQAAAKRDRMTTAEWVRQSLRKARGHGPDDGVQRKLDAIRTAYAYDFPTADIDQMNEEIERGYLEAHE